MFEATTISRRYYATSSQKHLALIQLGGTSSQNQFLRSQVFGCRHTLTHGVHQWKNQEILPKAGSSLPLGVRPHCFEKTRPKRCGKKMPSSAPKTKSIPTKCRYYTGLQEWNWFLNYGKLSSQRKHLRVNHNRCQRATGWPNGNLL